MVLIKTPKFILFTPLLCILANRIGYRISSNIRRRRVLTTSQVWCGVYWRLYCNQTLNKLWGKSVTIEVFQLQSSHAMLSQLKTGQI